jgi:hypothetical protein
MQEPIFFVAKIQLDNAHVQGSHVRQNMGRQASSAFESA